VRRIRRWGKTCAPDKALGENVTIQELLSRCEKTLRVDGTAENFGHGMYCFGVMDGVMGALISEDLFCAGSFVSNAQMAQIFMNWARKNPKHWQLDGSQGVAAATREAFPCK